MRCLVRRPKLRFGRVVATSVLVLAAGAALAADLEGISSEKFEERYSGAAVSEVNGKLELGYVHYDFGDNNPTNFTDGQAFIGQGALSLPVTHSFGLQIDGGFLNGSIDQNGSADDVDVSAFGAGAHLFWRDPGKGLLGLYGHYTDYEYDFGSSSSLGSVDVSNARVAAEAEAYFGQVTAKALAGVDFLDVDGIGDEEYLLLNGQIDYYFTENFRVFGGVNHSFDQTSGVLGAEALLDVGGISPALYANASFSEDATAVMAGVNIYFGRRTKSLMRRHREDDPEPDLFDPKLADCLQGIGTMDTEEDDNNVVLTDQIVVTKTRTLEQNNELNGKTEEDTDPSANLGSCEFEEGEEVVTPV